MRFRIDLRIGAVLLALAGAAVAQMTPAPASCDNCGVVTSIRTSYEEEQWTPLGVVAAPSSLTSGNEGRTAFAFGSEGNRGLVLIGAAGGAVYAKRPNAYQKPRWDVTIKMDRGGGTRVTRSTNAGSALRAFSSMLVC